MAKKIATWIIVPLMAAIFLLDIYNVALGESLVKNNRPPKADETKVLSDDRIHFLNTGCSDAILIESNGHFALIDSGEGDSNPRRKTAYKGYSAEVIGFLKKTAVSPEDGKVHLDFILGTHCHYDHIGAFEDIIRDEDIVIDKAYFKLYDERVATELESEGWQNEETYRAVIAALNDRNVPVISDIPSEEFQFGDFTLKFYNAQTPESLYGKGENSASICTLVTKGELSAFLAADVTSESGLEELLMPQLPEVTLLKPGHHGYFGSSSYDFIKKLNPKMAVLTNYDGRVYPNVKWNLIVRMKLPVYSTVTYNGITASFTDSGEIKLTSDIM